MQDHKLSKVSIIEISPNDPVFNPLPFQVSHISRLIGIPIAGRKLVPPHLQPYELNPSNSEATLIFQNMDNNKPDEEGDEEEQESSRSRDPFNAFGFANAYWQFSVGAVVIARLDKKPLHPLHASAFIHFCQGHIVSRRQELDEELYDGDIDGMKASDKLEFAWNGRQKVLDECTREKFEAYFKTYKAKRVSGVRMSKFDLSFEAWDVPESEKEAKPEWRDVGSPYEV